MTDSFLKVILMHVKAGRTIPKDFFRIKILTQLAGSITCHIMKLQPYFWIHIHILTKLT